MGEPELVLLQQAVDERKLVGHGLAERVAVARAVEREAAVGLAR